MIFHRHGVSGRSFLLSWNKKVFEVKVVEVKLDRWRRKQIPTGLTWRAPHRGNESTQSALHLDHTTIRDSISSSDSLDVLCLHHHCPSFSIHPNHSAIIVECMCVFAGITWTVTPVRE